MSWVNKMPEPVAGLFRLNEPDYRQRPLAEDLASAVAEERFKDAALLALALAGAVGIGGSKGQFLTAAAQVYATLHQAESLVKGQES